MKQQIVVAAMGLSIAAFSPVSSHQCGQVRANVLQPLKNVSAYLAQKPDLDNLSGPGCLYILQQFKRMPQGADLVRQMAAQTVEHTSSRCLYQLNAVEYRCNDAKRGETPVCAPQTFSYCGQWEFSMTNQETRYELAMENSLRLDVAYEKAQTLCGQAMRWDRGALPAARDLAAYIGGELRESAERVYGESCANESR